MPPEKPHPIDHKLEEIVHLIETQGNGAIELSPGEFSLLMRDAVSRALPNTEININSATIYAGMATLSGSIQDASSDENFYAQFHSLYTVGNRYTLSLRDTDTEGRGEIFHSPNALLDGFIGIVCKKRGIAWSLGDKLLSVEFAGNACLVRRI